VAPSNVPSPANLPTKQGQPTLTPTGTLSPTMTARAVNLTLSDDLLQLLINNGVSSVALQQKQSTSREYQAFQFLIRSSQLLPTTTNTSDAWWLQRFALTSLYWSVSNTNTSNTNTTTTTFYDDLMMMIPRDYEDHCDWRGIACFNESVISIVWPRRNLTGTLPDSEEWTMLSSSLMQIDLSENQLQGTLPTTLYQLSMLESLYLNSNNISGRLHNDSIVEDVTWPNLIKLYLDDNQLTGPAIPNGFQYRSLVRPLRKLYCAFVLIHSCVVSYIARVAHLKMLLL
jgi:hypothetical protein